MRFTPLAVLAATACIAAATPALAQSAQDEVRFRAAQERLDRELATFRTEFDRYQSTRGSRGSYVPPRGGDPRYSDSRYGEPRGAYYADERDERGYDPARDYRTGTSYRERVLSEDERVYAGNDGRYYCKRSDGTTGLVIGGAAGGILGNVIDGGRHRTAGTLIGGALGALMGRSIEQNQDLRCR